MDALAKSKKGNVDYIKVKEAAVYAMLGVSDMKLYDSLEQQANIFIAQTGIGANMNMNETLINVSTN